MEGEDRRQGVLLPEYLDDYVSEHNPVRVIDVFIDHLDLGALGFEGVVPEATGRPAFYPGLLLKIYVYGAICPERGAGAAMVMQRADTQGTQVLHLPDCQQ